MAELHGFALSDDELQAFRETIDDVLGSFDRLDELPEPLPKVTFSERDRGYRPNADEDPYNVFITKCHVKGAPTGRLAGKKIGIKDSIAVQGVPMTNGSKLFEGYIPNIDATVVTKILSDGGVIVGKLNMDDFSYAGTSETSAFGAVRNPFNPDYSPGGSSGGSSAAVAAGIVDIALGVDGAGSVRMPAASVGCVGLKPTNGLVSTFGVAHIDLSLECVGPIARDVHDAALMLETIAGDDPFDPQSASKPPKVDQYTDGLGGDTKGVRVGVLKESMTWHHSDVEVSEAVRQATSKLERLGMDVREVSMPLFADAPAIWNGIGLSSTLPMVESEGQGYWHKGYYDTYLAENFGRYRRVRAKELPPMMKIALISGEYLRREYQNRYYCKSQNLGRMFTDQLNDLLREVDAIATPTIPIMPVKLRSRMTLKEIISTGIGLIHNTCPFNMSGHPALSIPCAVRANLPVGLQLVGRHWEEKLLFKIGHAFEKEFDWRSC